MKLIKIFIFSLALCLMACAVSAGDIHGVEDEASHTHIVGIQRPSLDEDNWGAIPAPNLPNHENTHGLDIKPRVNEAHEDELEAHLNELRKEASSIQKEAPKLHVEDIIHEIEPPEDEGVSLTITFDNTPPAALGTEQLQTQLEILGAC